MTADPHSVLKKLERREPHIVERDMIRLPDTPGSDGRHSHVPERFHPGGEYPPNALIPLKVDTAICPRSVVLIKVH